MANKAKKIGVNKGIGQGLTESAFTDKVICKKCGKEIEFTLGSQLFLKCPRCDARIERNIAHEEKQAKGIVKADIMSRSKKAWLSFGFTLTVLAIAYNCVGFFAGLFDDGKWYLALASLPLVIAAYFCMRKTRTQSASRRYRFYARLALIINFVALGLVVVTAVPGLSDEVRELLDMKE